MNRYLVSYNNDFCMDQLKGIHIINHLESMHMYVIEADSEAVQVMFDMEGIIAIEQDDHVYTSPLPNDLK